MKALVLAAALLWGGAAVAQDVPPADAPDATMAPMPDQPGQVPQQTMPDTAPPDGMTPPAPTDNSMPTDNTMPADNSMPPPANPSAAPMGESDTTAMTPSPSTKDYPKCSRKVRDNCINPGGR